MNQIDLLFMNREPANFKGDSFISLADQVLRELGHDQWEVSITLCDDEYIRTLNRDFRKKDEPTDILTFAQLENEFPAGGIPGGESVPAGDIVISLDTLAKNTEYFVLSPNEELKRLLIHGLLHLNGMDHPEDDYDFQSDMLRVQEEILRRHREVEILKEL